MEPPPFGSLHGRLRAAVNRSKHARAAAKASSDQAAKDKLARLELLTNAEALKQRNQGVSRP